MRRMRAAFPGLSSCGHRRTSPDDEKYNCIAWAADDTEHWWWPTAGDKPNYWPVGAPTEQTIDAFILAFATLRYTPCEHGHYEPGFEKIALYADQDNIPTHMAKQTRDGAWSSKIGEIIDIQHDTLDGLEGYHYGRVVQFLRRPVLD
jgi:hypothetical protein